MTLPTGSRKNHDPLPNQEENQDPPFSRLNTNNLRSNFSDLSSFSMFVNNVSGVWNHCEQKKMPEQLKYLIDNWNPL